MMLSHSPYFIWKFFMIWLHKVLKLILKAAIMSMKYVQWTLKKPTLEIYLYLKSKNNDDSVKHV